MKAKLLYIIIILSVLAFLIGIGQARAERLDKKIAQRNANFFELYKSEITH
jgi:uncharacterized membrane protein